jgi:hypothetical protein
MPEALQAFQRAIAIYDAIAPDTAKSLRQGVSSLGIPMALLGQAGLI